MTDRDLRDLVDDLHAHLEATAELPVEERAGRRLGEAQAVAADAVGPDVPEAVVGKRVGQVRELLDGVGDTGDPEANEHVEAARDVAATIRDRLG